MRLAYFSPLNPQKSGISDYSEELLPHLARHADLTLFLDGFEPASAEMRAAFRCFDYRRDPACLESLDKYDAAVYHVGNDHRYHTGIVEVARERPGVVVLHDFALQDFFWGLARERGEANIYLDELAACHGERARREAVAAIGRGEALPALALPLAYPMNCRVARGAEGLVVHSEWCRQRLAQVAPEVPVAHVRMPVKPFGRRDRARRAWFKANPRRERVEVATFGLITPGKGIEQVLRALSALRGDHDFHYTLVGEPNVYFDVEGLIRAYGMSDRVTITGYVTLAEFERRIAETDIAVNLRERTVGETSASLCRIMAAGVPAIVSDVGWFGELPAGAVVKVDADASADALVRSYLKRLIEDARLRARIGANARRFIRAEHDIKKCAARYAEFIRETVARRARRPAAASAARALAAPQSAAHDGAAQAVQQESAAPGGAHAAATPTALAANGGGSARAAAPSAHGGGGGQAAPRRGHADEQEARDISSSSATRRLRLAYFSPLNPQKSGISDYSEELLPHLARHADLTLFLDGFEPASAEMRAAFRCFDYRRDPASLARLGEFDAAVYHVGNDHRYHAGIFDAARKYPGVVVLHDFSLQDFFIGLSRERGDANIYLDELSACHGERERARAAEYLRRASPPPHVALPLAYPMNCRVARGAEGLIVHSEWCRQRLERIAPAVPIAHINHHVTERAAVTTPPTTRAGGGPVRVASFGIITADKGIERTLGALAALRGDHDFQYTLVGEPDNFFDVRELVSRYGLGDRVTITGRVTLEEFERRIAETDIAVNLRERTVGEASGSVCRLMAAGVATVVFDQGWYGELPDDCVVKVDGDESAGALLRAYLGELITNAPLRARVGANARRHALAEHSIEGSAARYVEFIRETIEGRVRRRLLGSVAAELSLMGVGEADEDFMRGVASEVAALAPSTAFAVGTPRYAGPTGNGGAGRGRDGFNTSGAAAHDDDGHAAHDRLHAPAAAIQAPASAAQTRTSGGGVPETPAAAVSETPTGDAREISPADASPQALEAGRLPKIEGIDYKRAAVEYPGKLDAERSHYLKTKPFYNLANKPPKHKGDGMDAETHRHFCDFANLAVALALPAGARLLDVGCGSGWLGEYFARLGYDVTGIDISGDLVGVARERVARVPYDADHRTPLRCRFLAHDIEAAPLPETFDAVICYDSLHHFEDERAVFRHLAAMLGAGGLLFILEGDKPPAGSATEEELRDVMRRYETLESPFSRDYLSALLDEHGFAVVGDYLSVNGLFERGRLEGGRLAVEPPAANYLLCKKVADGAPASGVPDSLRPGLLRARLAPLGPAPERIAPGGALEIPLAVENTGDTLWLAGQTVRAGIVMPAVRVYDRAGGLIDEFHGRPLLPRAVAPGETVALKIEYAAPPTPGHYTLKVDLVDQHVCWFEERGSEPFVLRFEVREA